METVTYFLTIGLFLGTVLIVFGMKYVSAAFAARARMANDDAYRTLAEKTLAASSDNQASLTAIQAELAKVSASLAAVEKVLKQVE